MTLTLSGNEYICVNVTTSLITGFHDIYVVVDVAENITESNEDNNIEYNSLYVRLDNAAPTANFTYSPSSPTTADTIQFTDTSNDSDGTIVSWSWEFGDGSTSTSQNATHQYSSSGTYLVNLTVTDDDGASDTCQKSITVNNVEPTANFSYTPSAPTTADTIQFTDTSTDSDGTIVAWSWEFGDGSTSTSQHPTHQYSDDGTYLVNLTVTDNDGATNTTQKSVTVSNVAPIANFTYTPSSPTTADTIQFTDTSIDSDGTIVSWSWEFGDGATATAQNPTHQYSDDGTYLVNLTVTDDDGATNTTQKSVTVGNVAPTANFTYTPSSPTTADTIQFTDTSTDSDGTIVSWSWEFGDGVTATAQNPTHQYDDDGIYYVNLTVTDDDGATNTTQKTVTVGNVAPTANFTYTPSSPTTADTIAFTDTSTDSDGTIVSWSWQFGDGATSTAQNPTHQCSDDGTYLVNLTVTDDDGASDTCQRTVTVSNVAPTANFTYTPSSPTTADTLQFNDTSADSDGTIVLWSWQFGDGATSTSQNPTHQYSDDGTYLVNLTVTDNDGATNTTQQSVTVSNVAPTANFTYSPSSPTTADTIQFNDTSTDADGTIASWSWQFGDGATSTSQNPTHQYSDDGTYLVNLTVTDNDGASDTVTKEINVSNVAPVANFTFTPASPSDLQTVSFTDTSTDSDGTIATWYWEFGDGGTSTVQNPTHQYEDDGTYYVNLTVTDDDGATDTCQETIEVSNVGPTADFTYSPTTPTSEDIVQFTDLSTDNDGIIVSWSWEFGDGSTSTSQNASHQYSESRSYLVNLTVTDDDGYSDTCQKTIGIGVIPPIANFTFTPETPTDLDTIQFTDTSTDPNGNVVSWFWEFGDGGTSTEQNPTYQYADDDTYDVNLTVWDNESAFDICRKSIVVSNVAPTANFTYTPSSPAPLDPVEFLDLSTDLDGEVISWFWEFGDGSTSTSQNPTHQYVDDGIYYVNLTVTDDDGATDTCQETINVTTPNQPPTAVILNSPSDVTTNSMVLTWSQNTDSDFANYTIYRSTMEGMLGNVIAAITNESATSFNATGLSPSTIYYFTIRVYDTLGLYNDSNQVNGTTLSEVTTEVIGYSGGTVVCGNANIVVPAGAVAQNTTFNVTTAIETSPSGFAFLGTVYQIEATVTSFAQPITITLSYDEEDIPTGIAEKDLAIYKKDNDTWLKLDSTVDQLNNIVSANITSLSYFSIMYEVTVHYPPTSVSLSTSSDITSTSMKLSWSQNNDANFKNYTVYKSTTEGALGDIYVVINNRAITSVPVTDLSPSTMYHFTVRVYNVHGLHNDSEQVSAKTLAEEVEEEKPIEAPVIPINLYVIPIITLVVVVIGVLALRKKRGQEEGEKAASKEGPTSENEEFSSDKEKSGSNEGE